MKEWQFASDLSQLLHAWNIPPAAGRIMGMLCLSDNEPRSAGELSELLETSRGAVSSSMRILIDFGLVKSAAKQGSRVKLYQMNPSGWARFLSNKVSVIGRLQRILESGISLKECHSRDLAQGMRSVSALCSKLEIELRALLERLADSSFEQKGREDS